jgi:hypothetical protein
MTHHLVKSATKSGSLTAEPWVDLAVLAKHIGFSYMSTRRMVAEGKIPGKALRNGKKTFWRFQLSAVDAAFAQVPWGSANGS